MKGKTVLLLAVPLMFLYGCGEDTSSDNAATGSKSQTMNEVTRVDELPSFLSEGMSEEEMAELREQIMPGSSDGPTPGEKFQALLERAQEGDHAAQTNLGVM